MEKNKIDIIEKYIIDTITTWGYDSDYTKGIYDTGLDILNIIDKLKSFDDDDDINIKELW